MRLGGVDGDRIKFDPIGRQVPVRRYFVTDVPAALRQEQVSWERIGKVEKVALIL